MADPKSIGDEERRRYHREWYANNPDKVRQYRKKKAPKMKAYSRRSYEKHRAQVLERSKQRAKTPAYREGARLRYAANLEEARKYNREKVRLRRATNHALKEKERAAARRWYWQHIELQRDPARIARRRARTNLYKKTTTKGHASMRRSSMGRRAREAAAFVEHVDPALVFSSAAGVCGICHAPIAGTDKWHVDHILPLSRGGAHSYANTQPAHAFCNISKGAKVPHHCSAPPSPYSDKASPIAVPMRAACAASSSRADS